MDIESLSETETESDLNFKDEKIFGETADEVVERCTDKSICDLSFGTFHKTTISAIKRRRDIHTLLVNNNYLENLDSSFLLLRRIKHLNLSQNLLTYLPENFGDLSQLNTLILHNNSLVDLPDSFALLSKLTYLDLQGNPYFQRIRSRVGNCETTPQFKNCAHYVVNLIARRSKENTEKNLVALNQEREQTFMRTNHSLSAVIRNDGHIYLQGLEPSVGTYDNSGPRKISSFVIVLQNDYESQENANPITNARAVSAFNEGIMQTRRRICIISVAIVVTLVTLFLVSFFTVLTIWRLISKK